MTTAPYCKTWGDTGEPCNDPNCVICTAERARRKKHQEDRLDWDTYFLRIASVVAQRATCDRKHVGAVLVKDLTIISTGYNGAPKGMKHCDEVGHMMENGHCVRTVHAETNAIVQAAKNGSRTYASVLYTTASPCWPCFREIVNAGITSVVFGEIYRDERITDFAREAKILLIDFSQKDGWRDPFEPVRAAS